jgi:hypothetical protein
MNPSVLLPQAARARRYALHFQVYFRERDSLQWRVGTTENISHSGVLFVSTAPMALETTLDLRLPLVAGAKGGNTPEIHCKGAVVRLEQRNAAEAPIALAVAMRDCRIVRKPTLAGHPVGNA